MPAPERIGTSGFRMMVIGIGMVIGMEIGIGMRIGIGIGKGIVFPCRPKGVTVR